MLENINYALFYWINATPASSEGAIAAATFIAKEMILLVPLLAAAMWLWGPRHQVDAQRHLVLKMAIAIVLSLALSWVIGHLFPHARPFAVGAGYNFLHHAADDSFPSDHGTVAFTFGFAFLFWHRRWSGALLLAVAGAIAWSRIYLGVHWPLDMVGGFLAALSGCLGAQLAWTFAGVPLYRRLRGLYRVCFALPIRKGWVRD